jgi:hypothetical protein
VGVRHFQRVEDVFLKELVERDSRNDFDQAAHHIQLQGILPIVSWLKVERHGREPLDGVRYRFVGSLPRIYLGVVFACDPAIGIGKPAVCVRNMS